MTKGVFGYIYDRFQTRLSVPVFFAPGRQQFASGLDSRNFHLYITL